MNLFIVESPTKIHTLKKILKSGFIFVATLGHIKDLPEDRLGIDLNNFIPNFYYLNKKKAILKNLAKLAKKVKEVYLATDPDREGEAIAYHMFEFLSNINPNLIFKRLDLIELTEYGVKKALSHFREINLELYESWLTRRVGDRIIGYLISPYLSKCLKKPLSAGRVQSVALRLIVEREREIENFESKTWYSLEVLVEKNDKRFWVELYYKNKPYKVELKEKLIEIFETHLKDRFIEVQKIEEKEIKEMPPYPLKTSSLIEMAQKLLNFEPKETMKYAQNLYEAGYITYMRTDSLRVSEHAKNQAKRFIEEIFGKKFIGEPRKTKMSKFSQDAHECIRPTNVYIEKVPFRLKENKLYQLIRDIFIASQMAPARYLEKRFVFKFNTEDNLSLVLINKILMFEGFWKILRPLFKLEQKDSKVFDFIEGEKFWVKDFRIKEHKTQPPPRYTFSSLIKKLESLGIGRPSTYATIFDVLFKRNYIIKKGNSLVPTELGIKVCDFLTTKFSTFLDYKFTAYLEEKLEKIAKGQLSYDETIKEIYGILKKSF